MGPSGGGCARAGPTPPSEARSHTSAAASVLVTALLTKVDPEPGDANRVNPSNRSEATPGAPARGFPDSEGSSVLQLVPRQEVRIDVRLRRCWSGRAAREWNVEPVSSTRASTRGEQLRSDSR